jgi:hypothetical protein
MGDPPILCRMRWLALLALAAGLLLCSCRSRPPHADESSRLPPARGGGSPAGEIVNGWPVLGGLRHHCDGQALGVEGAEIIWSVFVSTRPPAEIAALYEQRLGTEPLAERAGEWTWRVPTRDAPTRVLTITGPTGPVPGHCPKLPPDVGAVANLSEMLRR